MAQFSQGFLSSLGRPEMSQSLFGLGAAIGGVPGQMKQRKKEQGFNQLMQQVQAAQGSGDFASMKALSQQMAQTNPQQAAQIMQAAISGEEKQKIAQEQTQGTRAGAQMLMSELQDYATDKTIPEALRQRAGNFLRAAAQAGDRASLLEPRVAELRKLINQNFAKTGRDRTTKGEVIIRDSKGNFFTRASQYDEQGRGREVILPFPGSPEKPVGNLTIVSGTTGGGMFDRPGVAGQTTEEQKFNEARVSAVVQLPSLRRSAKNIRESIDLLESGDVTTGGFVRRISRGLTDFLGKTPKDIGEFETRLGDIVLARLESFTGAISEGERKFLIEQIGSYQASGESNLGRLKVLLEQAEDLMRDGIALGTAKDFSSYQQSLMQPDLNFIPKAERQEAMEAFQRGEVTVQELRGMY